MASVPPLSATSTGPFVSSMSPGSPFNLKLGSVAFADLEHPEKFPIPLAQQTAVHQQAGGTRTVQTFGVQPGNISWRGTLFFQAALARAGDLRRMATTGKPVILSWGPWSWEVIVKSCDLEVHHQYEVAYAITCIVVKDKTSHATQAAIASIDAKNQALYNQVQVRFNSLQQVDGSTAAWGTSIAATGQQLGFVSPITSATTSAITQALAQVQATIGVVSPYVTALQALTGSTISQQLFLSQGILSGLQLISTNLGSGNPATIIQAVGGSLFSLAAKYYGDPSLWGVIAAANNLTSPFLAGGNITSLVIPPKPAVSTGTVTPAQQAVPEIVA